jgi:two-component system NtrC family sensor kinase
MSTEVNEKGTYYRALSRNMVLVMIFVSVMPLLLISGTLLYYFNLSYRAKVLEHLAVLVKKHRQNVDTFLGQNLASVHLLAQAEGFNRLINESFLKERLLVIQEAFGRSIVDLGVVNDRGIQIAYAGPFRLKQADYSEAQWFKEAIQRDSFISDVFHGLRGLPHFIVAVRQEYDGAQWILRATVDFEAFNSIVENIRIGTTGFAFILNTKGEFQTRARLDSISAKEICLSFAESDPGPSEEVFTVDAVEKAGKEVIQVMSRLKHGEWILAFQQDAGDAFSVVYHARRVAVLIFLLGLIGIIFAAFFLARRMVKRISDADRARDMMDAQVIEAGKLVSIGELAAGIAHEINNPVAIMVEEAGWIEDLLQEEDLKETENLSEFRRALNQIRTQGRRCKEITHKLLSFARKTDPAVTSVQLNEVVREVVALSEQRARYSNVRIAVEPQEGLPPVKVSPSELQQVMLNLINNSLDAMDSTGGIITVSTAAESGHVIINVADNGPGIPRANLQRIFDPFFTTKPVGKGTGLGLSICYGIVKKMGGEIQVSSAVGVGTSFSIRIPSPSPSGVEAGRRS